MQGNLVDNVLIEGLISIIDSFYINQQRITTTFVVLQGFERSENSFFL
jgi:hypothetical protein